MKDKGRNLLCVRKSDITNRDSTFAELQGALFRMFGDKYNLYWDIKQSPLMLECKHNGNQIIFRGVNDEKQREKLKSITFKKGKLTDVWIEEATEITQSDFEIIDDRLRGQLPNGQFYQIRCTFNPVNKNHWIKKVFFDIPDQNVMTHHSTYLEKSLKLTTRKSRTNCRNRKKERKERKAYWTALLLKKRLLQMNKRQKLVQEAFLNNEEAVIKRLKVVYSQSLKDITKKAEDLQNSINSLTMATLQGEIDEEAKKQIQSMIQSKIYQKQYQDALKKQIGSILDNMQVEEFKTVAEYLEKCYEEGFIGTMYDLHGQGIPLILPLDQEAIVRAVQIDSKISKGLYSRLGEDVELLKKKIISHVSRGISTGMSFQQVAQQLAAYTNIGFNNAVRIARTEGHRIQIQSTMDTCYKAKEKGADVVKQWDSTLDKRTRKSHQKVDGEIRELDEPFSNGLMFPGDPACGAAEVVNCRCALLQRARWALDDEFTKRDSFTGELREFNNPKDYDEFKKWYFSKENLRYTNYVEVLEKRYETSNLKTLLSKMTDGEYNHFRKLESESPMWKEHERITKSIVYAVDSKTLESRSFVEMFDKMTNDSALRREYLRNSKEMLKHRSGQNGEDLYLYNTKTKRWVKSTTGKEAGTPEYTDEIKEAILKANKGELISFHNHPASMPPSADDINAAFHNGYSKGYVLCHNGKIYEYTASDRYINISLYNLRIADFQEKGYTEFEAQLETMKYLSKMYGFEFKEVK